MTTICGTCTDALPCHIHLPVCLLIMDPHSRAPKENTSHGNEVLLQDTTHLIQRPCQMGPHEDPLTTVKRCKLQWYGHVSRSSGPTKTILQGTVKGGIRQGRQRNRWEDIREWTGLEFGKSQRAVENGKMEKTGCKIICGTPTTLTVKRLMMMMMMELASRKSMLEEACF